MPIAEQDQLRLNVELRFRFEELKRVREAVYTFYFKRFAEIPENDTRAMRELLEEISKLGGVLPQNKFIVEVDQIITELLDGDTSSMSLKMQRITNEHVLLFHPSRV